MNILAAAQAGQPPNPFLAVAQDHLAPWPPPDAFEPQQAAPQGSGEVAVPWMVPFPAGFAVSVGVTLLFMATGAGMGVAVGIGGTRLAGMAAYTGMVGWLTVTVAPQRFMG